MQTKTNGRAVPMASMTVLSITLSIVGLLAFQVGRSLHVFFDDKLAAVRLPAVLIFDLVLAASVVWFLRGRESSNQKLPRGRIIAATFLVGLKCCPEAGPGWTLAVASLHSMAATWVILSIAPRLFSPRWKMHRRRVMDGSRQVCLETVDLVMGQHCPDSMMT